MLFSDSIGIYQRLATLYKISLQIISGNTIYIRVDYSIIVDFKATARVLVVSIFTKSRGPDTASGARLQLYTRAIKRNKLDNSESNLYRDEPNKIKDTNNLSF